MGSLRERGRERGGEADPATGHDGDLGHGVVVRHPRPHQRVAGSRPPTTEVGGGRAVVSDKNGTARWRQ